MEPVESHPLNLADPDFLNNDGTEVLWPEADVIIGNPPFLGDKLMNGPRID